MGKEVIELPHHHTKLLGRSNSMGKRWNGGAASGSKVRAPMEAAELGFGTRGGGASRRGQGRRRGAIYGTDGCLRVQATGKGAARHAPAGLGPHLGKLINAWHKKNNVDKKNHGRNLLSTMDLFINN